MTDSAPSDSLATRLSLLSRVRDAGDHRGWEEFFHRYRDLIRRLAIRSGLSEMEADDVLQETMSCLVRQMPEFRYDPARGSFKSWLSTIVRRRVIDQLRKRRPEQSLDDATLNQLAAEQSASDGESWESEWHSYILREALARVRAKVSALQFQMFELSAVQELKMGDVQRLLGVNAPQVYMAKMRVGTVFRKEHAGVLAELGEPPRGRL